MQVHRIVQCALWLTMASVAHADHWPAWRGADCRWSLPGKGRSSHLVRRPEHPLEGATPRGRELDAGDLVFVTQATDKGAKRSLICFNRHDGSQRWIKTIEYTQPEPTHSTNPFCAASPVTNGERVVVSHGSAGIACYDFDGNQLWHRDLGPCHHIWGTAASPVIAGDLVFLNFGPGERTTLYAFRLKDGTDAWKSTSPVASSGTRGPLSGSARGDTRAGQGRRTDPAGAQLARAIKAYDPPTGRHLRPVRGCSRMTPRTSWSINNPLFNDQVIVAMGGFQGAWIGMKVPTESLSSGVISPSHTVCGGTPKGHSESARA